MEHFFESIQGWMQCENLYKEMVRTAADGARFVEVGAWKGRSAAFMAVEIINSGKNIHFTIVDNFQGSKEHAEEDAITSGTLLSQFLNNMLPVSGHHTTLISDSAEAAAYFADASVDFCYIDASHEYENVRRDISAWLPKIVPGGVLAGDDYEYYPGVAKAVDELLPGFTREGNIWRYPCPSP